MLSRSGPVRYAANLKRKTKQPARSQATEGKSRFAAHFSHVLLVLSGMLLMVLIHYLFFPGTGRVWNLSQEKKSSTPLKTGQAPRWGKVEYVPLALIESRWSWSRSKKLLGVSVGKNPPVIGPCP